MSPRTIFFSTLILAAGVLPATIAWASEGGDVGFPQLNPASYPSQVFWLFVSFVLMYLLMSFIALPRVGAALERRQSYKDEHLGQAGSMSHEASVIREGYEKALAEAQQAAFATITAAEQEVQQKIADEQARFSKTSMQRLAETQEKISKEKEAVLSSLEDIAAEIAADMVRKIADIQPPKADAKKAVTAVAQKG